MILSSSRCPAETQSRPHTHPPPHPKCGDETKGRINETQAMLGGRGQCYYHVVTTPHGVFNLRLRLWYHHLAAVV